MKKLLIAGILLLIMPLTACSALDVVRTDAVRAFGDLLSVFPAEEYEPNRWRLAAPGGGAWFAFDEQFIEMEINALPFIAAGADVPERMVFGADVSRELLGYHAEMDHYNLDLGGAVFEWAKDMSANDKDIVFALDPAPLIAAGVDPEAVEGWAYTQVPAMRGGKAVQVWKFLKTFNLQ
jgi:hypothetical protein